MRFKRRGLYLLIEQCGVAVLDAQAPLRVHHAAFGLDHFGVEGQIGQSIALELQHQLERRARKPILVDRHVLGRIGVVRTALCFHQSVELALGTSLRAVEHHVLEEMRQAGLATALVAAARPHPDVQSDIRDVVVRPDDQRQAIAESVRMHACRGGRKCVRRRAAQHRRIRYDPRSGGPLLRSQIVAGHGATVELSPCDFNVAGMKSTLIHSALLKKPGTAQKKAPLAFEGRGAKKANTGERCSQRLGENLTGRLKQSSYQSHKIHMDHGLME